MNKSPSSSISRPRWLQITSNDGSYMIQLSGLSIFVVILSSVAIALFSGRLASIYLPTWLQLQLRHRHVVPAQTVCPDKMINYEALVHPAMITHLNPKRVAVLNGNQRDTQTSARAMREVLKHVSVQEAYIFSNIGEEEETLEVGAMRSVLVTTAQECSSGNHALFDVIIDPNPGPVDVFTDFSSHFKCLGVGGVLAFNIDMVITNKDSALGVGKLKDLGLVIDALEGVGYESVHLYEDDLGGRSYLVALKSHESRAEWYSNAAEIDIRLHQRIGRTDSLEFFDSPTMLKYQVPSKAVETAYCHENGDKCVGGFDPELNVPVSDLTVGKSTMGEFSGRGLFAKQDIPRGRTIGNEKSWLSYFIFPSTHRIMFELYNWADENSDEGKYVGEVLDSIDAVVAFSEGYGFWSSHLGRAHSTVDPGVMMFCNHGCNGTFNLGDRYFANYTEANIDSNQPPPPKSFFLLGSAFSPAAERNLRQMLTTADKTNRDINEGEEILCNYLEYIGSASDWEEDIRGLQGQCAGTELGEISAYEQDKK